MTEYVRVAEAAKKIGVSRQRLYWLIKEKHVTAVMVGGLVHVDMQNLGNWQPGNTSYRRPKKTKNP